MIGSINKPVLVSSIVQLPPANVTSQFFGYNGGYQAATSIDPGKAYWVKTTGAGKLVLYASPSASPSISDKNTQSELGRLNVLMIEKQSNGKQPQIQQKIIIWQSI